MLYYGQKDENGDVSPNTVRTVFSKRLEGSDGRTVILDGNRNFNKFNIDGTDFNYNFTSRELSVSNINGSKLAYNAIIPKVVYDNIEEVEDAIDNKQLSDGQLVFVKVGVSIE